MATASDTESTYEALLDHVRQLHYVGDAGSVLQWDQQVMMPDAGTPARAKRSSAISTLHHELLTDDQLGEWLDGLEASDLDDEQETRHMDTGWSGSTFRARTPCSRRSARRLAPARAERPSSSRRRASPSSRSRTDPT
jgi:Zn-dependent M32 family carboxypeptidase